ncbi:glycosyltransferase [Winogradskyella eckloniae]|uniref:glycosyltransferase n=1 Tax=Winogradskyella eckloniae TaxID=1089306 RepID=UPI0015660B39|nr:glycosyltransferase [Winogradskyella eckloniae]NRD19214.1 glycosyltransferase [Winogradskyella eckloniae]
MKLGIIIIFYNNGAQIDKKFFREYIKSNHNVELCLVDNNSSDNTLSQLEEIKEWSLSRVSVIEIKKKTTENAAKKAGARYMFNQFNLKHIGFISVNTIYKNGDSLNSVVQSVCENYESIIDENLKTIAKQDIKQTLFKSIFSVVEYLKIIKSKTNINSLSPSI